MKKNALNYIPPYTISNKILLLVSEISAKVERMTLHKGLDTRPQLRKSNRIKSIHSSLKIEANSLSFNEVRDVINGRSVIGKANEIQEVKNTYKAYEQLGSLNAYKLKDLKRIHGVLTEHLLDESGEFRSGAEGVFREDKCIFMAPPPQMVLSLMENLFAWMKASRKEIHPLILSAIFHYEFVFIHPFADGNGRTARLWHTALLYNWEKIFEYIPLESQIEKFQQEYYSAIANCHKAGNSNEFIEFILERINEVLAEMLDSISDTNALSDYVRKLLDVMEFDTPFSAAVLMERLNLKSRDSFRDNYLRPAIDAGLVQMTLPDKPNSRNQRYIKK